VAVVVVVVVAAAEATTEAIRDFIPQPEQEKGLT
jgi:hypothetical protein